MFRVINGQKRERIQSFGTKFNCKAAHKAQQMHLLQVKPEWRAWERQHLSSGQMLFGTQALRLLDYLRYCPFDTYTHRIEQID